MTLADLALQNLLSPMVLFFVVGLLAAFAKSDLTVPEPVAKLLSLYLLMSIGFRGGAEVTHHGLTAQLAGTIGAGILLSFAMPFLAYAILKRTSRLSAVDAAAVAGHYGSISAVTFAAVTGALNQLSMPFEGYMVAVAAAMETPAIMAALVVSMLGFCGAARGLPKLLRMISGAPVERPFAAVMQSVMAVLCLGYAVWAISWLVT